MPRLLDDADPEHPYEIVILNPRVKNLGWGARGSNAHEAHFQRSRAPLQTLRLRPQGDSKLTVARDPLVLSQSKDRPAEITQTIETRNKTR